MPNKKNYKIEIIDDVASADFIFKATAESISELFEACAYASMLAITDPESVDARKFIDIEVSASDLNELLYNFISEIIYLKDTEKMFFSKFDVIIDEAECKMIARVGGETIDFARHIIKTDVKAVTFHELDIKKSKNEFNVKMILDL